MACLNTRGALRRLAHSHSGVASEAQGEQGEAANTCHARDGQPATESGLGHIGHARVSIFTAILTHQHTCSPLVSRLRVVNG